MTVFVIELLMEYNGEELIGIYSNKDLAIKELIAQKDIYKHSTEVRMREIELDKVIPDELKYF